MIRSQQLRSRFKCGREPELGTVPLERTSTWVAGSFQVFLSQRAGSPSSFVAAMHFSADHSRRPRKSVTPSLAARGAVGSETVRRHRIRPDSVGLSSVLTPTPTSTYSAVDSAVYIFTSLAVTRSGSTSAVCVPAGRWAVAGTWLVSLDSIEMTNVPDKSWRWPYISISLLCSTSRAVVLPHGRWNYVKAGGAQSDFQLISFYATP